MQNENSYKPTVSFVCYILLSESYVPHLHPRHLRHHYCLFHHCCYHHEKEILPFLNLYLLPRQVVVVFVAAVVGMESGILNAHKTVEREIMMVAHNECSW